MSNEREIVTKAGNALDALFELQACRVSPVGTPLPPELIVRVAEQRFSEMTAREEFLGAPWIHLTFGDYEEEQQLVEIQFNNDEGWQADLEEKLAALATLQFDFLVMHAS